MRLRSLTGLSGTRDWPVTVEQMDGLGWKDGVDGYFQQPPSSLPLHLSAAYVRAYEEGVSSRVY